jgi:hypothetical protein
MGRKSGLVMRGSKNQEERKEWYIPSFRGEFTSDDSSAGKSNI